MNKSRLTFGDSDGPSIFLSEIGTIRLQSALWTSKGQSVALVTMVGPFWLIFTVHVGNTWSGSSLQTKSAGCWWHVGWVLGMVFFFLGRLVPLFWDKIINALSVLHSLFV